MPKASCLSKFLAIAFVVLSISVIAGIVTMVIFYKTEISKLNPTPRPTFAPTTTGPPPVMRLPTNLLPESYRIFLQPHFYTEIIDVVNVTSPNQTLLFTGNSTVNFHCVHSTSTIFLHSKELLVSAPAVTDRDTNKNIRVDSVNNHEDESNFLEIQLNEELKEGRNYSLFLAFEGEISEILRGLYISFYVEGDANTEK